MKKLFILLFSALMLAACGDTERTLPSATGSIYEVLVVMPQYVWQSSTGDSVRACMEADMPCMPQMEPYFSLSHTPWAAYDALLKPVRNILEVDINGERYTQVKVSMKTDLYSHPQAVCRVTAPSEEDFALWYNATDSVTGKPNKEVVRYFFLRQELTRYATFLRTFTNQQAREAIQHRFGADMRIPNDYQIIRDTTDFIWCCCDNGSIRRDLIIYSYPYTDARTFTPAYLLAKRDSILGSQVSGYVEGSYMGTEYKIFPPQYEAINVDGAYCAELRGLWRMYGGAAMGGPFVQHTRIDDIHQRVITAESFIFAAGQKKRNAYRQGESILYTLRLPQDVNTLQEVEVK